MSKNAYKGKCKCFIVWSPDGPSEPKRIHETHPSALHEAHRLSKLFPGRAFYVMARASKPCLVEVQQDVAA